MIRRKLAWVMELADMRVSKTRESNLVGVRLSPQAPIIYMLLLRIRNKKWQSLTEFFKKNLYGVLMNTSHAQHELTFANHIWQKNLEKLFIGTTK